MARSFLTDEMWARLAPLVAPERGGLGRMRLPNHPMVEANDSRSQRSCAVSLMRSLGEPGPVASLGINELAEESSH